MVLEQSTKTYCLTIYSSIQITSICPPGIDLFCNLISLFVKFIYKTRAYADAGSSVRHSEQVSGEEPDFGRHPDSETESEKSVEASSGDEDEKDEGGEGKKKKQRSGFRDRKVINKQ